MNYIETIRMEDNVAQNLEYHTARMSSNSSARLPELSKLNSLSGRVKCRVLYNADEIVSVEFMPYQLPIIGSLRVVESDTILYDKKYEDRGALSALYAERGGSDDIIICRDGAVGDSYFCNLIFARDGRLFTSDTPLLCGTKRQQLIDSGVVVPCRITRDDIVKYDGVYLVNAMIDLTDDIYVPISRVDGCCK